MITQPWFVIVRNDDEGTVVSYDGKTDLLECGYFALIEWKSMYKKILQDFKEGGLKALKDKIKEPTKESTPPPASGEKEEEEKTS